MGALEARDKRRNRSGWEGRHQPVRPCNLCHNTHACVCHVDEAGPRVNGIRKLPRQVGRVAPGKAGWFLQMLHHHGGGGVQRSPNSPQPALHPPLKAVVVLCSNGVDATGSKSGVAGGGGPPDALVVAGQEMQSGRPQIQGSRRIGASQLRAGDLQRTESQVLDARPVNVVMVGIVWPRAVARRGT